MVSDFCPDCEMRIDWGRFLNAYFLFDGHDDLLLRYVSAFLGEEKSRMIGGVYWVRLITYFSIPRVSRITEC